MTHTFLALPLPEEIRRLKEAGRLKEADSAISAHLSRDLPAPLRQRLLFEQHRLRLIPLDYTIPESQALGELQKYFPSITKEDFESLEKAGKIDFVITEQGKRYFIRFARSLYNDSLMKKRFGLPVSPERPYLDDMIRKIRQQGSLSVRYTLESSLRPEDETFRPGLWRGWLPFPAECAQQHDISLISGNPDQISHPRAMARTAYFERVLTRPETFSVTYSYISTIRYADPLHAPAPSSPLYPDAMPPCEEDLMEDDAHIRFTPYLRALAREIAGDAKDGLEKAWRCYRFVTTRVSYSFMPAYILLDNLAEFSAVNLRGDCGLQALLFVVLCRILGVPARWQSGLSIDEDDVGSHDWAQFYAEGWGWLFADCSYGGSAWRCGSLNRHAFYFGNLDGARMAANRVFMADFTPDLGKFRRDPCDSQTGEMDYPEDPAPLLPGAYERHVNLLSREEIG